MECPYCRSQTLEGARKCAACGSWIDQKSQADWTRPQEGRRLGGVCRGLADRFGIPVAALRLLFIGSIFLGGWGALAYIALWIAMPAERLAAATLDEADEAEGPEEIEEIEDVSMPASLATQPVVVPAVAAQPDMPSP